MEDFTVSEKLIDAATSARMTGDLPGGTNYEQAHPTVPLYYDHKRLKQVIALARAITPPSQLMMAQSIAREESDNSIIVDVTGMSGIEAANKVLTIARDNPKKHVYPIDVSEGLKDIDASSIEEFEHQTMALNVALSVKRGVCSIDEIPKQYQSEAAALLGVIGDDE